eukprot:TRINITY_DN135_c0_g1_i1.p2 TRINITY_DN135_c0_g1~~TRINITY_DN135_c0_g1_i1.p2  ORF type:complete len:188 (+),score=51.37 TRINITY_DN135_c0_g1_i1:512-1075(+)
MKTMDITEKPKEKPKEKAKPKDKSTGPTASIWYRLCTRNRGRLDLEEKETVKVEEKNDDEKSAPSEDEKSESESEEEKADVKDTKADVKGVVTITKKERARKKYNTIVAGLEEQGVNIKDLAKALAKKFASNASIAKNNDTDKQEISIQGDIQYELADLLTSTYKISKSAVWFCSSKGGKKKAYPES